MTFEDVLSVALVRQPTLSPDGRSIAYRVTERTLDDNRSQTDLWIVSADEASEAVRLTNDSARESAPAWSPDGKSLAFLSRRGGKTQVWLMDRESREFRQITHSETDVSSFVWSPDGGRMAYVAPDELPAGDDIRILLDPPLVKWGPTWRGAMHHLWFLNVASGKARRLIAPDFQGSILNFEWSPGGREILLAAGVGLDEHLYTVNLASGKTIAVLNERGTGSEFTLSRRGEIAIVRGNSTRPAEVYFSSDSRPGEVSLRNLTNHNSRVEQWQLADTEDVLWTSKDGTSVEGLLIKPVGYRSGQGPFPTLVYLHGGPNSAYTHRFPSVRNYGQWWAGQGWAVFYPNFRGSTNYGDVFMGGNVKDWGGRDFEDVMTGLDHLISEGIADPERLAIAGWSYGGYLTAWILSQTDRFQAASYGAGTFNLVSMYGDSGLQLLMEAYLGRPWDETELYHARAPVSFEAQIQTPTIIFQGERDTSVPRQQSQDLFMSLQKRGVPSRFVLFPRAGHGLSEPKQLLEKMRLESRWIRKHVLGEEGE